MGSLCGAILWASLCDANNVKFAYFPPKWENSVNSNFHVMNMYWQTWFCDVILVIIISVIGKFLKIKLEIYGQASKINCPNLCDCMLALLFRICAWYGTSSCRRKKIALAQFWFSGSDTESARIQPRWTLADLKNQNWPSVIFYTSFPWIFFDNRTNFVGQ